MHRLDDLESDKPENYVCFINFIKKIFFFKLSAIINKKNLMIVNLNKLENPANLQFQDVYGEIMSTKW